MIYDRYASVYDFSGQIRFALLFAQYLTDLLRHHHAPQRAIRRILDIACGTGTLAFALAEEHNCEVIGLDASSAMLDQARKKAAYAQMRGQVTFIHGDMRFLTDVLPTETFDLVTCSYDSLNYLLTDADLLACFSSVAQVLVPGGLFIGDMNTRHFMEFEWSQCEIQEQPGYIQIEQSHFDAVQATSTLVLTGFIGNDNDGYERFDETHIERAYPTEAVAALLEQATLHVEASYNCFSLQPPSDTTQRILWVGRKPATHAGTDG